MSRRLTYAILAVVLASAAAGCGTSQTVKSQTARLGSSSAQASLPQAHPHAIEPSDNPGNTEVNHIQLIPSGGPLPLTVADVTFAPDPTCS
jgi:hypothetical protein